MAPLFPAILIGGPPHSGKSTLTYRVSQALHQRGIAHYALRASPDGEGNWSMEAPQALVAELRMHAKSDWSAGFAAAMSRDIAGRHLPLLVDAGGKPSPETAQIATVCTHALLLAANPDDLAPWRDLLARQGRGIIAELHSVLDGAQQVTATSPVLRGTLNGLQRGQSAEGPCLTALVDHLARYMAYPPEQLYREHLARTPIELVINVEQPIYPLPRRDNTTWLPADLPTLLAGLPPNEPLAIYGRGPNWLYAALAAFAPPRLQVFTALQGWVDPPALRVRDTRAPERLRWEVTPTPAATVLTGAIPSSYLDYRAAAGLPVPPVDPARGLIMSGKLPNWLYAALAQTYRAQVPWLAVFQPQLRGGVVVWSQADAVPVGAVVGMEN